MKARQLIAGRFDIEKRAGAGGMGTVYRANDRQTGRPVAVKVIHGDHVDALGRFSREAQTLEALGHPGIVGFIAHGTTEDGELFLAMEWLDGSDLSTLLQRGPLPLEATLTLARKLAEALAYAHQRGIIHRDIKPANIFLEHGLVDRAKLLDFGLARTLDSGDKITKTGDMLGTPGYMAPEQARGHKNIDARVDIFALGSVLYRCLTGESAFGGETSIAILMASISTPAPRLRSKRLDVPESLDTLVARMLANDPDHRPRDGQTLLAELNALVLTHPTRPEPPTLDNPTHRMPQGYGAQPPRRVAPTLVTPNAYAVPVAQPMGSYPQPVYPTPPPAQKPNKTTLILAIVGFSGILVLIVSVAVVLFLVRSEPKSSSNNSTKPTPAVGAMAPPKADEFLESFEGCLPDAKCRLMHPKDRKKVDFMETILPEAKALAAEIGDQPQIRRIVIDEFEGPNLDLSSQRVNANIFFSIQMRTSRKEVRIYKIVNSGRQLYASDETASMDLADAPVLAEPKCTLANLWANAMSNGAPTDKTYSIYYGIVRPTAANPVPPWYMQSTGGAKRYAATFDGQTCKVMTAKPPPKADLYFDRFY